MTGRTGFITGVVAGFIIYSFNVGLFDFSSLSNEGQIAKNIVLTVALLSSIFTFLQYYRKKVFISTTTDGFIAGFASVIDIFAILSSFSIWQKWTNKK